MTAATRGEDDVPPDEAWTNAELMRAIIQLTHTIERLEQSLDRDYLRRDVADERYTSIVRRVDSIAEEQVNLGASMTRNHRECQESLTEHQKQHAERATKSWETWVVPLVTGVLVAAIGAVIVLALHGGHA